MRRYPSAAVGIPRVLLRARRVVLAAALAALQILLLALAALAEIRRLRAAMDAGIGAAGLQVDLPAAAARRRLLEPAPRLRAARRRRILPAGIAGIALLAVGVALVATGAFLPLRRRAARRVGLVVVLGLRHGGFLVARFPVMPSPG